MVMRMMMMEHDKLIATLEHCGCDGSCFGKSSSSREMIRKDGGEKGEPLDSIPIQLYK